MSGGRSRWRRILEIEIPILLIVLFALAPYAWLIITSLKPSAEIALRPVRYWPSVATLQHYHELLARTTFAGALLNSLIIASGAALIGLATSVPAAYAFSRFRFPGRRALMTQFLAANMFPVVLLIIPLFVLMRMLGLLDTHFGIILGHSTFAIPFATWLMTSYLNAVPRELDEAAIIDGASRLQTIRLVLLPVAMPGIVTAGIYIFISSWNEYLFAMMLSGEKTRPVTVALQTFIGEFTLQWGLLSAGGSLVALPVAILFLSVQKKLAGGLTAGAVKT